MRQEEKINDFLEKEQTQTVFSFKQISLLHMQ